MPSVSVGELRMITSHIPSIPTDQDAVETFVRQRDCVIRAAADAEVLLPLAPDSEQTSTAAPADDDQSLCGREEALRLVDEIMDFQ